MTQSKLSEKLDYTSERQLQRIENGETACSVDKLMEISQILGISTDFLLFGDNREINELKISISGKTDNQILYIKRLVEVAVSNMELL